MHGSKKVSGRECCETAYFADLVQEIAEFALRESQDLNAGLVRPIFGQKGFIFSLHGLSFLCGWLMAA
jgi:predicted nucleic acid-binding Zn ribbon protein